MASTALSSSSLNSINTYKNLDEMGSRLHCKKKTQKQKQKNKQKQKQPEKWKNNESFLLTRC